MVVTALFVLHNCCTLTTLYTLTRRRNCCLSFIEFFFTLHEGYNVSVRMYAANRTKREIQNRFRIVFWIDLTLSVPLSTICPLMYVIIHARHFDEIVTGFFQKRNLKQKCIGSGNFYAHCSLLHNSAFLCEMYEKIALTELFMRSIFCLKGSAASKSKYEGSFFFNYCMTMSEYSNENIHFSTKRSQSFTFELTFKWTWMQRHFLRKFKIN